MRPFVLPVLVFASALFSGCASAPVKPATPAITDQQKLSWILRLEDQRILKAAPQPPPAPAAPAKRRATVPPPAPVPDLLQLVTDPAARTRRRAAIAIGRVGLPEGAPALETALRDSDPEVRQMAAFGLGLIGDKGASPALAAALQDADPLVRGRAAEALGLIGDPSQAAAIGQMTAAYIKEGAIASMSPDDERAPGPPKAAAVRLGLFALVRLKAWEPLAGAVLDAAGKPVSTWWPVAFALQRIDDPRARPALAQLANGPGVYGRAFAIRGLGALKDAASVPALLPLLDPSQHNAVLVITAMRALAQIGAPEAAAPILARLTPEADPNVRLEAVAALGALHAKGALPVMEDLLSDPWPAMRAAALHAAAAIDPEAFVFVLSGLEPDRDWLVRAALADVLGTLPSDVALNRLRPMLHDSDKRVVPAVLRAMTRLRAPDLDAILLQALRDADVAVRSAAAAAIGRVKPAGGAEALRAAYRTGTADADYSARAAALSALARYGASDAVDTLTSALGDRDWAVRVQAADLLKTFQPTADLAHRIRPVPSAPVTPYDTPDLIAPPYSPHAFIETAKGTIEIELAVLEAPQTTHNFMALARKGFFNGLSFHRVVPNFVVQGGDPRGDGEGGPGYTIRDELNEQPFVRGAVGMALSWRDTGGSQFFITHSPQPHLDAKYTCFGHVVHGMAVVDRLQQGDVIQRVRIWDGTTMQ